MTSDRITHLRVEGLRVFDQLHLDLCGMNVLIGDNGSGKSTLLEAFELLRRAADPGNYADIVLAGDHGPIQELVRFDADRLTLGVVVEGAGPKLEYSFTTSLVGTSCVIQEEHLDVHVRPSSEPLHALTRVPDHTRWFNQATGRLEEVPAVQPQVLAAPSAAQGLVRQDAAVRLVQALKGIAYHPPFDVRPLWQQREQQMRQGPRWPARPTATELVERYGYDLPAAFAVLRNDREKWERVLERARAAVGADLIDMLLVPVGSGQLDVSLRLKSRSVPLPLRALSEGQLSYLILLAVVELGRGRTLLALDEPDIHYHPELVVNLVQVLEESSNECPIVIATHSDRLLDALETPAESVLLCEVQPHGAASLRRPNAQILARWLERYRGLGEVNAEGYVPNVFDGGPMAGQRGAS